jgi:uncharacterized sporulation protein YeaH/YhbH (DUF444 family)
MRAMVDATRHDDERDRARYDDMTVPELLAFCREHIESAKRTIAEERRQREELDHLRRVYGVPLFRW